MTNKEFETVKYDIMIDSNKCETVKCNIMIGNNECLEFNVIDICEKQVEKEVLNDGHKIPFSYYCPNCKEELSDGGYKADYMNYCYNCGQKIKWN